MAGKKQNQPGISKVGGSNDHTVPSELWQEISVVKESIARLPELERNMALLMAKLDALADAVHLAPLRQWEIGKQKIDEEPMGHSSCHGEASQTRINPESWKDEQLGRRMEMPIFTGGDPDDWIFRVEHFFALQSLPELEKLQWVAVHLEGEALAWYQWEEHRRLFRSWNDVRLRLLEGFRPSLDRTLSERFLQLKQTGSVREYHQLFERAASHLLDLSKHLLEAQFLTGLRSEIQAELLVLHPAGLDQLMLTAQRVEEKFTLLQQTGPGPGGGGIGSLKQGPAAHVSPEYTSARIHPASPVHILSSPAVTHSSGLAKPNPSTAHRPASSFCRLLDSELLAKREKGLCYRCDERFSPGYRCKSKDLLILMGHEIEGELIEQGNREDDALVEGEPLDSPELAQGLKQHGSY